MRPRKTTAIILKRTDFGEADRIITALTPNGKISLLARGVRKQQSKLASGIELLSENELSYIEGKGELMTLISSRSIRQWPRLLSDYDRLQVAYKILRHIQRITERHGGEEFYEVLKTALSTLDVPDNPAPLVETWFSLRCLALSGHEPNLKIDQAGEPLIPDAKYKLDPAQGTLSPTRSGGLGQEQIKLWRLCLAKPLDFVLGVKGAGEAAESSPRMLERFISYQYK